MSSKQHSSAARFKKPAKRRNRRTRRVWVSRDVGNITTYNITSDQPPCIVKGLWNIPVTGYAIINQDPETFKRFIGIKLQPGECRQFDMLVTMTPVGKGGGK